MFDDNLLIKAVYRAAAFIINEPSVDFDILHSVVWSPMRIFKPPLIKSAISAWGWIIGKYSK